MQPPVQVWNNFIRLARANRRSFTISLCALLVVVTGGTAVALSTGEDPSNNVASPASATSNKSGKQNNGAGSPSATLPGGAINPDVSGGTAGSNPLATIPGVVPGGPTPNDPMGGGVVPSPNVPGGGSVGGPVNTVPNNQQGGGSGGPAQNAVPTSPLIVQPVTASPNTNAPVNFAATVENAGAIRSVTWDFGDGSTSVTEVVSCDTPTRAAVSHNYRAGGTYTVTATASTGSRCGIRASDSVVINRTAVTVNQGASKSNGPLFPTVAVVGRGIMPEDPHVSVQAVMADLDGYISQVTFDWNDPAALPTVINFPMSECADTQLLWPSSTRTTTADHDYTYAGTYTVTVTVTTVGCDGGSDQQAIGVLEVTAGGTSASNET